jgi:hypothetical protein
MCGLLLWMVNPKIDALLTEATVEIKKPDGEGL